MKNYQNKIKIEKVSKVVRALLLAGLILQALAMVIGVVVLPFAISNILHQKSGVVFDYTTFPALPFAFMVTLNFFRFFSRLKNGYLFDAQTVKNLQAAGRWWIALGIIQMISASIEAFAFAPHNVIISGNGIFAGLMVIFTAWLFREAQELEEEQELTV